MVAVAPEVPAADAGGPEVEARDPSDLAPGSLRVYGLLLPVGTSEHLVGEGFKMFYISASMSRVMRYMQRNLVITTGDIRPLGAMIRQARVRFSDGPQVRLVDVGLRDEGDKTFVTIWERRARPEGPPVTTAESLRRVGIDPDSGRALPAY
ncbi:MAG: hypothetical protein Q8Q09_24130 [Deltaproteobacteria bacterium]|nr:hypothetical protein [Deltaproteobacteria bacterium]